MRDAYLAVDAATDLHARARDLRRGWDAMVAGDAVPAPVRTVVARSWSRLAGAGLDPTRLRPRAALDEDALAQARVVSRLRYALPALRHHLGAIADDAEHVMVVCDASGRILWLEGHPRVLELAQGITFTPGMLWTERSAGTNAIGTALAIDHPVQIFSAEHFLPEQHQWWCSAAPLHDPETGDLLGIVDVSGPQRTAHPYSLTLVTAAARIAGTVLRERRVAHDDHLRQAYLERIRRARGIASALVDVDGRVLLASPPGWLSRVIAPPTTAGRLRLSSGAMVEVEPLGDGAWVLWAADAGRSLGAAARSRPKVRLQLLGRNHRTVEVDGAGAQALSLRQAEVLTLLALHPEGLTAEQLTWHLYGDDGKAVTIRALLSRLREVLGGSLRARPYRLDAELDADFLEVMALLDAGEITRALARYGAPLVPDSDVERIVAARDELAAMARRAALVAGGEALRAWVDGEHGREDLEALHVLLDSTAPDDARRAVIATRLSTLRQEWGVES